jgi:hypothetical protein
MNKDLKEQRVKSLCQRSSGILSSAIGQLDLDKSGTIDATELAQLQ